MAKASDSIATVPADPKRRKFLLTTGLGIGGAAAAAVGVKSLSGDLPAAAPVEGQSQDRGYQATEHVRNYYRTARI